MTEPVLAAVPISIKREASLTFRSFPAWGEELLASQLPLTAFKPQRWRYLRVAALLSREKRVSQGRQLLVCLHGGGSGITAPLGAEVLQAETECEKITAVWKLICFL